MLLPLFASAVVASAAPPDALAPAPPPAAAGPAPTIDSLLEAPSDTDEDAGASAPQGPVPYSQLGGKAYDDALHNAAAAARLSAGPLDGGWTLAAADDGRRLYRFQILDHGYGVQAEGAWRDLDGGARLKGSGFIDQVGFTGDQLMLRFYEAGASDEVVVTVRPAGAAAWAGQLRRHGAVTQITLRRDRSG